MNEVGILGGTFDPIHLGHLKMVDAVTRQLGIRRVMFIPDGDPPHKGTLTGASDRLHMVRLAMEGKPGYEASSLEVKRQGITYTVDTLKALCEEEPDSLWCYIVGADTLDVIETWKTFDVVAKMLSSLAVVPRNTIDRERLKKQAKFISEKYGLKIYLIDREVSPISSTEIRLRAQRHLSLDGYVPPNVEHYIINHRLYTDPILDELRKTMTLMRYRHTLGVETTAEALAKCFHVDPDKARMAALLHDCAKHLPMDKMVEMVERADVEMAEGEKDSRALLHAAAGMILAKEQFGVTDPDVLSAIRWHTTGRAGMSDLEKVIYLADMIEPGRRPFQGIEKIRDAANHSLNEAMAIAAKRTVLYVRSRGMPLNQRTLELLQNMENNGENTEYDEF